MNPEQADFILVGNKIGELYGYDIYEWHATPSLNVFFIRTHGCYGLAPNATVTSLAAVAAWVVQAMEPF